MTSRVRPDDVLPTVEDLWGGGWDLEEDDDGGDVGGVSGGGGDGVGAGAAPLTALPAGFPDTNVVGGAERTWNRDEPPALVHTVVLAFDGPGPADTATALLAAPGFAARLAGDVAVDAPVAEGGTLLPPVVRRLPDAAGPVAAHRAVFAFADGRGTSPIVLDVAVVRAGATVVLAMAVTPGRPADDAGWRRLLAVLARRAGGPDAPRPAR